MGCRYGLSDFFLYPLNNQAAHGIYGYQNSGEGYFEAVSGWMKNHHDWHVEKEWMVSTPGVVFALATVVRALTGEGDAVMIQQPVYYPFASVVEDNGRKLVNNNLVQDIAGNYHMDLAEFEEKIISEKVKLFLLCNPHNPVGRVYTKEELNAIGDICVKHGVLIASDEIHADFVFEGKHQVLAALKPEFAQITVTCTAPSKTFNIAGLQVSNIFIPNGELREKVKKTLWATGYEEINSAGMIACEAAYSKGEEWYRAMKAYVYENIQFAKQFIRERIPEITMVKTEGTYLIWLDFRKLQLSKEELDELIIQKAGLWLDDGSWFGEAGTGFQRVNTACPRAILKEALERLEQAISREVRCQKK